MHISGDSLHISASQWNLPSISTAPRPGPRSSTPDSSHPLSPYAASNCIRPSTLLVFPLLNHRTLSTMSWSLSGTTSAGDSCTISDAFQNHTQHTVSLPPSHHRPSRRGVSVATGTARQAPPRTINITAYNYYYQRSWSRSSPIHLMYIREIVLYSLIHLGSQFHA
jgi:hypothetical protein